MEYLEKKYLNAERHIKDKNEAAAYKLFMKEGWEEYAEEFNGYLVEDLDMIDKTIEDLPYPNLTIEESTREDYVDSSGITRLPANKVVWSFATGDGERPVNKRVSYMGRSFEISYYHDSTILVVRMF